MCGRYKRRSDKQRIADVFAVATNLEDLQLEPEDDIAPQSIQPVIHINDAGQRQMETMRWAFKLPKRLLFNARSEDILTSPFWKDSFLKRHCIVPADAIFEWKETAKKKDRKPRYEFTISGQQPFGMAAVWKLWKNPATDEWERTFAVLTGDPNEVMAPIHNRMTIFVEPCDYEEYMAPSARPPVHLLRILPAEKMRSRLVDTSALTNQQVGLFDSQ